MTRDQLKRLIREYGFLLGSFSNVEFNPRLLEINVRSTDEMEYLLRNGWSDSFQVRVYYRKEDDDSFQTGVVVVRRPRMKTTTRSYTLARSIFEATEAVPHARFVAVCQDCVTGYGEGKRIYIIRPNPGKSGFREDLAYFADCGRVTPMG